MPAANGHVHQGGASRASAAWASELRRPSQLPSATQSPRSSPRPSRESLQQQQSLQAPPSPLQLSMQLSKTPPNGISSPSNAQKLVYFAPPIPAPSSTVVIAIGTLALAIVMHQLTAPVMGAVTDVPVAILKRARGSEPNPMVLQLPSSSIELPLVRGAPHWSKSFLVELSVGEALKGAALLLGLFLVRRYAVGTHRRALASGGQRVLNLEALNRVVAFKDIMSTYLSASLLQPLLSIADSGDDPATASHNLVVNVFQLLGICSWLHFVHGAFDSSDVTQGYAYRRMRLNGDKAEWLRPTARKAHHGLLAGEIKRDVCLWLMLFGIGAAQVGMVTHREALHSYASIALWCVLHHLSRSATSWGSEYWCTLLMPSAALVPLKYCLPLADREKDFEALTEWRHYIKGETGIELIIEHPDS